ncbi:glycosyltransferase family 1 protein [Stutzerimonas stutzeri]|uniref:Glycosyltransferase family 1 protein n=1 Tax=Stutzerimonas stutzeri TaxID=316 RepID=A0A2S4AJA7_STUST|nr:glycosyltransferase family 4 protein [Stutzerimonas stutzeri]MCQ4263737.1 glycosyltransferase family 4 protein [Stutzerimonas stutzeri]POH81591.1 glycosyltransferase family 1 protein [Stutzerimonas stutzeri]
MLNTNRGLSGVSIARVSTVSFFVQTQLRSQIGDIAQNGGDVMVVASDKALGFESPGVSYASIHIPRKIEPLKDLIALIRLWLFFRRSNFQIVHSTTPKAGLLCSIAALVAGVPVRLHTFTGQAWVEMRGLKRFLSKGSDKLIALLNTRCYADSKSQKEFIVNSGVAKSVQIHVLGSGSLAGIDLQRFRSERFCDADSVKLKVELNIPANAQVLLFVGRLTKDKGIVELLAAFEEVVSRGRDTYLILLGPHEVDIEVLLSGLSADTRQRISMPGFSVEPERYMVAADLLVLPSYREGFGTVVIEAAAVGLPAVCTNIYGLADAVVDGETGVLVPVKDEKSLAAAIDGLLVDPDKRRMMGRCAQSRVEREFSSERISTLLIEEYVELLRINKEKFS